jgi:hypothetical protein
VTPGEVAGLVVSVLVLGLSVGYAVGWVEGVCDRWLWRHLVVPLYARVRRRA